MGAQIPRRKLICNVDYYSVRECLRKSETGGNSCSRREMRTDGQIPFFRLAESVDNTVLSTGNK